METNVFDRIEKKYLITKEQKRNLLKVLKNHMDKDKYFKSEVYNLYFDTDNYDLIIQSIDQPTFKEKLRARSYGGYDRVFLEIKTKIRMKRSNPGFKRRVMINKKDFEELVAKKTTMLELAARSIETEDDLQIAKEVDYLIKTFDLKPKILVMYHRESYQGEDKLRITFDEKLKYRDNNLRLSKSKSDKIYFEDERNIIMEIKAQGVLPLWLAKAMSANKTYPEQFSKVGKIFEKIRKEQNV
ncbi:polyphosphate polymerase domain-containing protein [Candidatus Saccharibacteria bacterium]|nr:polyphosphate polymerase domain-containing protein [Candidatus Saccharibacteria bacterium]